MTTTTLNEMFDKLTTEEIRTKAAEILAENGHELVKYNGRSNAILVDRNDGRRVLLYVYRNISTDRLRWSLSDENLYGSTIVG